MSNFVSPSDLSKSSSVSNAPDNTEYQRLNDDFMGHPKPLRSLFLVEMWERFSYYGIRPLLVLFMTAMIAKGGLGIDDKTASAIYGIFASCLYLSPIIGGYLADNWLGQERALWWGSIVIALGHLFIGLSSFLGVALFFAGLALLVAGTGLFKTCISVMVGSLYGKNDARRDAGFTLFYMGINLGAFIAPLVVGGFKEKGMWHLGFAIGGIGMLVSLLIYRLFAQKNLKQFAGVKMAATGEQPAWQPPQNVNPKIKTYVLIGTAGVIAAGVLIALGVIPFDAVMVASAMIYLIAGSVAAYFVYLFLSSRFDKGEKLRLLVCFLLVLGSMFFWSSFEQQPTSFNLFADRYTELKMFGFDIPSIWFQSLNPLFILIFAPVLSIIWVKLAARGINPSSMTKFALGMFFAGLGSVLMMFASQAVVDNVGLLASPWWLVSSLFLLTLGELCLSPVGLSSMTKLAPDRMQGVMMGLFFASIAMGNLAASFAGGHVSAETISDLPKLFMMMTTLLMVSAAILYGLSRPITKMIKRIDTKADI